MERQINEKLQGGRGWTRITRFDLIKRNLSPGSEVDRTKRSIAGKIESVVSD